MGLGKSDGATPARGRVVGGPRAGERDEMEVFMMIYFPSLDRVGELRWANDREKTTGTEDRSAPAAPGRNVLKMERVSSSDGHDTLWVHQGSLYHSCDWRPSVSSARISTQSQIIFYLCMIPPMKLKHYPAKNIVFHPTNVRTRSRCSSTRSPAPRAPDETASPKPKVNDPHPAWGLPSSRSSAVTPVPPPPLAC